MSRRETIRLTPSPFRTSGPTVEYDIEVWECGCSDWEIVVASSTWREDQDGWHRDYYNVRKCGFCSQYPRPKEEGGGVVEEDQSV